MDYRPLTLKKKRLETILPLPIEQAKSLDHWFRIELTFTSNALEGNTLTRLETAEVIEKGNAIGGKSLREHLEATNHAKALDLIYTMAKRRRGPIEARDLLAIHETVLKGIDDTNAGRLRSVPVRISGSLVIFPSPRKVSPLIDQFLTWINSNHGLHPVALAGEAHFRLVSIHPFVDGNGRTARLLMNLLLLINGYPPAVIRKQDRMTYLGALEKAQLGGSREVYDKIIFKAVNRSLDLYLSASMGKPTNADLDAGNLLKIGQLAKAVDENISTIRHWTKEKLIEVAEMTPSGYQLYAQEMIARCGQIKALKGQRFSLSEIREKLA